MTNVFISYRRSDTTSGYASWIYDRLAQKHGAEHVFMDLDSLPLGVDFVEHLQKALEQSDVALVLIGPGWLGATDASGHRRLDDPNDFVRLEVGAALRASARVIPVLIEEARMPEPDELPEDLVALTRRQSLTFQRQGGAAINNLLATIEEMAQAERTATTTRATAAAPPATAPGRALSASPPPTGAEDQPDPPPPARRRPFLWLTAVGILAIAVLATALALGTGTAKKAASVTPPRPTTPTTPTAPKTTAPGSTSSTPPPSTTPQVSAATGSPLGRQLNSNQQTQVLVPLGTFQSRLGQNYSPAGVDSTNYALHGGLTALSLCNGTTVPRPGFAGDESNAYQAYAAGGVNLPPAYVASDAGTFNGQGAVQFMKNITTAAQTCGWTVLSSSPTLDDQVIRLTMDAPGPDNAPLHNDLIFVRAGPNVEEVGAATANGTHSADADFWAAAAARTLASLAGKT